MTVILKKMPLPENAELLVDAAEFFLQTLKEADPQVRSDRKQSMIMAEGALRAAMDRVRSSLVQNKAN